MLHHMGSGRTVSLMDKDGQDKHIAYASRSLAPVESNYSQLEKEGLAIFFGVKQFTLICLVDTSRFSQITKPLQHVFSRTKATPIA